MSFKLNSVVPWGRNFSEYKAMFMLTDEDLQKKIAGFGDGPASFNFEADKMGMNVTSYDIVYQFSKVELQNRIEEVRGIVMEQMAENMDNYVWKNIKSLDELERIRMSAMNMFLEDFEIGKAEGRYVYHNLPDRVNKDDNTYDIGLSSHFLLMYTDLGYDFHIKAISEMLRVCKEVRIFPVCDLDGNKTDLITKVSNYLRGEYCVNIIKTKYEFQKGNNEMMIITKQMN